MNRDRFNNRKSLISLGTAKKLKAAGLSWQPVLHDFFAIPDRDMDDVVFVISEMLVTVDFIQGMQVVSFQGASEWALDALVTSESVWLPSETQLRNLIEEILLDRGRSELRLMSSISGFRCEIWLGNRLMSFEAVDASETYAAALLFLLEATNTDSRLQSEDVF
jgi:hypothetical protein